MTTQNNDLSKRIAAAHKAAVTKALHHLAKAAQHHVAAVGHLKKCAGVTVGVDKVAAGLPDLAKSAKVLEAAHATALAKGAVDLAEHIAKAHQHLVAAQDHHDVAVTHLQKVADSWGIGKPTNTSDVAGLINDMPRDAMTEGDVAYYDVDQPYDADVKGEGLGADGVGGTGKGARPMAAGLYTKEMVDAMVKSASEAASARATADGLQKQIDMMSRLPAGAPRIKTFAIDKFPMAGDATPEQRTGALEKLMDGVSVTNPSDPDEMAAAASRMIGNMMKSTWNGDFAFGRNPILDPSFRGKGGRHRVAQ